jgi:hypothetical protein
MGMYIGGGNFIHAPHTGDVVKISCLSEDWYASTYVGAKRIVGSFGMMLRRGVVLLILTFAALPAAALARESALTMREAHADVARDLDWHFRAIVRVQVWGCRRRSPYAIRGYVCGYTPGNPGREQHLRTAKVSGEIPVSWLTGPFSVIRATW